MNPGVTGLFLFNRFQKWHLFAMYSCFSPLTPPQLWSGLSFGIGSLEMKRWVAPLLGRHRGPRREAIPRRLFNGRPAQGAWVKLRHWVSLSLPWVNRKPSFAKERQGKIKPRGWPQISRDAEESAREVLYNSHTWATSTCFKNGHTKSSR